MGQFKILLTLSVCSAFLLSAPAARADDAVDLTGLSLEDLFAQEVSSVAKRPQNVKDAPAAVFVIGREDIRRSGMTTIPDLLRMVPGMEVATLPNHSAGVTARGFNGRFANKLLVLLDGRAIYLSAASGVLWDQQMVPVEDIERIEVVRGPGATLWGANAVNGVINIITRHPIDSQGGTASIEGDGHDSGRLYIRQGARVGETGLVRFSAQARRDLQTLDFGGLRGTETYNSGQAGLRYDAQPTPQDAITLQGDVAISGFSSTGVLASYQPVGHFKAHNALARWTRTKDDGEGRTSLQGYYDYIDRTGLLTRHLFDLDFSSQFKAGQRHDVVWGLGFRRIENRSRVSLPVSFRDSNQSWYEGFIQDDISLMSNRLKVSLGAKLEHNPRTGFEVQPSLRAIWLDPAGWSAWGAVSRAVRTPSDFEADASIDFRPFAPLILLPAPADAEELMAYELGWRGRLSDTVTLDATAFYNDYGGLIGTRGQFELVDGAPTIVYRLANLTSAVTYGAEASLTAQINPTWKLQASATLFESNIDPIAGMFTSLGALSNTQSPSTQLSVRSMIDLRDDLDLDIWARHVGKLDGGEDAYNDLNVRMAWRPTPSAELFFSGENLLNKERIEIQSSVALVPSPAAVVERRLRVGLRLQY